MTRLKFFTCKYFGWRSTAFEANEFKEQIEAYNSYKKITPSPSDLNGMYICHNCLSTWKINVLFQMENTFAQVSI